MRGKKKLYHSLHIIFIYSGDFSTCFVLSSFMRFARVILEHNFSWIIYDSLKWFSSPYSDMIDLLCPKCFLHRCWEKTNNYFQHSSRREHTKCIAYHIIQTIVNTLMQSSKCCVFCDLFELKICISILPKLSLKRL